MSTRDALALAEDMGMDLVLVGDNSNPPVCKILDYKKMVYQKEKKVKANKADRRKGLKEIIMGYQIMDRDIEIKAKNVRRLLKEGNKVKLTIRFTGREIAFIKNGENIVNKCIGHLKDMSIQYTPIKTENSLVYTIISNNKTQV